MRNLAVILTIVVLAACGSAQTTSQLSGFDDPVGDETRDDELNREAFAELRERALEERDGEASGIDEGEPLPVEVLRPEPVVALTTDGRLRRSVLTDFHAGGPHAFLGAIELIPAREGDSVLGYAIGVVSDDASFVLDGGLMPGDIVRTVNGNAITTPDGFIAAWDALPEATRIEVALIRDGAPMTLAWDVADE
jgi:hypothetical protein